MKIFLKGLATGLLLQLGIGPVFFFIVNLTFEKGLDHGFVAILAVTIVDYFYIVLAIFGVGELLKKEKIRKYFRLISSVILIVFGMFFLVKGSNPGSVSRIFSNDVWANFATVLLITISSPAPLLLWMGLLTSKTVEKDFSRRELIVFGISAGLATLVLKGGAITVISIYKQTIPIGLIQILNVLAGVLLLVYGMIRFRVAIAKI